MHHTIHKLVHQAVLRVNKPRDEIAKLISREIEKPIHQLTKGQCKKLESSMDTVIDEAKDTKFMHTEPTKDKAFNDARKKVEKIADQVDKEPAKEETKSKAPAKKADEETKSKAPAKKAPAKKEDEEKKSGGGKKKAAAKKSKKSNSDFNDKLERMGSLKEDHLHLHEKKKIDDHKKLHGGHAGGGDGSHAGDHGLKGGKGGHGGGSHGAGGGHISHDHGKGK